jgi:hypothetical protein
MGVIVVVVVLLLLVVVAVVAVVVNHSLSVSMSGIYLSDLGYT